MTTLPYSTPTLRSRVPAPGRSTIRRRRLLDLLDRADTAGTVTLLTAPAGAGKTTLLADWVAARRSATSRALDAEAIAWLTVDESDNDLAHLREVIVSTFSQSGSAALAAAVESLPTADDPSYANFTAALVDALESVDEHITLILDDCHLLHENDMLTVLGNFLRWPPRNVRTIVAGRFEPPLALQKLRLDGLVHDISPSAIAFTEDEASQLFARSAIELDPSDSAKLMNRTEGWAAGLRLAAMALTGSQRPPEVIEAFTGSQHSVADYLVGEILSHLTAEVRTFLLETSVPEWFTTDLAERLTGNPHAQDILDDLIAQNFLLDRIPESDPVYRYHPLMREYLRAEIARLGAAQIRNLERVASSWFNDYRQPLQALSHSVHAGDCPAILAILVESGLGMVLRGNSAEVLSAIEHSPVDVRRDPTASLISAAALMAEGNTAPAVSILSALRRANYTPHGDRDAEMLRRALELHATLGAGNTSAALDRLEQLDAGASGSPELDAYTLMVVGLAHLHLSRFTAAQQSLSDAAANARAGNLHLTVLACLTLEAGCQFLAGHLSDALGTAEQGREYALKYRLLDSPVYAMNQSIDLIVAAVRLDPTSTPNPEDVWAAFTGSPVPAVAEYGRRAHWVVEAARASNAREASRAAGENHGRHDRERLEFDLPVVPAFEGLLVPMIAHRYLASGQVHRATELVELTARRLGRVGEVSVLAAEVHRFNGRLDAADTELNAVITGSRRCLNQVTLVRALLASACVAAARAHPTRAFDTVVRALAIAEPESILLPFAEAGLPIRDILSHNHGRFGALESFADLARAAVPQDANMTARRTSGALTRRELELLRELPSWRTAEQIAADHFVSVNTVKTHLRGIYRKLEVRSRRDAIATAHELGLL